MYVIYDEEMNSKIAALLLAAAVVLAACGSAKSIPVRTGPVPDARNIEASACADPTTAIEIIDTVLSRFQAELSAYTDIEAVYICEDLFSIGVKVPAASTRVNGKTVIYVDAGASRKVGVSFTHELFHALEFSNPVDEDAWARINPYETYPFETASPGEIIRYNPNMIPAFEPGFVTDYARFSAMEDRAELFTILYSDRELSAKERAALLSDPFLMEKVAFLKEYLSAIGFDIDDNLLSVETNYSCRSYKLLDPELVLTGPSGVYPKANVKAGQLLADSGFESDGIKMLYDEDLQRVYAPLSALEPLDTTVLFAFPR